MRIRGIVGACVLWSLFAGGCSDDDDGSARCEDSDECTRWRCNCNDGAAPTVAACIMGRCGDESLCDDMCENSGGVKSVEPAPSVASTPECDAYCAKVASLGCENADCNRSFHCAVGAEECEEQVRAYLQCQVDTGTWSCQENGWGVQSNCSKSSVSCP